MADRLDTMGGDLEVTNTRQATSNAPSIWDRLPYNIGMELHHCAFADNYTIAYTANDNASSICYQQLHAIPPIEEDETKKTSTTPPEIPTTTAINKISESIDSSRSTSDSQGPTCIPLLPPTYQQHYLPFLLNSNSNDMKIDRNFKNSKSITSLENDLKPQHEQQQQDIVEQSPNNNSSNLLPAAVVNATSEAARFNDDDTEDNRGTCTKIFPVDNRISNKMNLVIKFNEIQSTKTPKKKQNTTMMTTAVRRKTPSGVFDADGASDRRSGLRRDIDEKRTSNHDSDMTATTAVTTTISTTSIPPTRMTISKANRRVESMGATTMVGSTSRRLNCCPTAQTATSSLSSTTSSSFSSSSSSPTSSSFVLAAFAAIRTVTAVTVAMSVLAGDVLRKAHITMRKDKKTMTAATVLYLVLYIFTSATCTGARQDASNCSFPQRWEGSWFLSGYQQSIHIKGSQFSYRGKCAASDGNKYLIVDEKGCHRCLVIYEKHKNVLQYKESECEGDSMYMHQSNPSAMAMRSILKSDHRGGAHPNLNGHSRLSSSDQYIMRSNDDMNDYFCKGRETLQNLCDQIPGDALLYSLFRENAEPVKCPLKGPFVFTYNRGHGECKSPVSNIESCTEDSRLLLSFQACPDVQGTESTVEELTCLATWKDGNSRYLVGLVSHHHAISNEERYRCFVYEKISSLMGGPGILSSKDAEYKLAQSGDATCNGLDSAEVGSRIMSLRKPPPAERCDFPVWFKGPRHWHALMGNSVYNYHPNDGSMHIIKPNGYMETRALCEQINKQTATEMMAVVHYTTGCQSGFMCMIFYRRDTHVIEIQTGKQASRLEDACAPDHFDINKMPYITLLASNPDPQICPLEGLYHLRGPIGPPYISSRHKRNHNNNKGHTQHGHHHHDVAHKRHTTLSLRNSDESGHTSWHSNAKGLPVRSRRDANSPTTAVVPVAEVSVVEPPPLSEPSPSSSAAVATVTTALKSGSKLSMVNAIETNDLNHHGTDGDDTTSSSLLLKLPPRQLSHDNVQSGRITIATGSNSSTTTTTNQLKESVQQQQSKYPMKHQHQTIASGIISDSNSTSRSGEYSSSVAKLNESTARVVLAQRSRRDAPGCIVNYKAQRQLWIGCTGPNLIDVRPQCNEDGDEEYSCHGSWSENGTVYVIARHKGTKHGVCISYRPMEGTAAKLVIGDACYRGVLKPPEHHLVANLTVLGKCGESSAAHSLYFASAYWKTLLLFMACIVLPIQLFTNR